MKFKHVFRLLVKDKIVYLEQLTIFLKNCLNLKALVIEKSSVNQIFFEKLPCITLLTDFQLVTTEENPIQIKFHF